VIHFGRQEKYLAPFLLDWSATRKDDVMMNAEKFQEIATNIVNIIGKSELSSEDYLKLLCLLIGTRVRAMYHSGLIDQAGCVNLIAECEILIVEVIEGHFDKKQ